MTLTGRTVADFCLFVHPCNWSVVPQIAHAFATGSRIVSSVNTRVSVSPSRPCGLS